MFGTALEISGFLRVGEAGKISGRCGLRDFDAKGGFAFGASLTQDGEGGERFVVSLGDKKGLAGIGFLPNLTNLDLFDGHDTNVNIFPGGVNKASAG